MPARELLCRLRYDQTINPTDNTTRHYDYVSHRYHVRTAQRAAQQRIGRIVEERQANVHLSSSIKSHAHSRVRAGTAAGN
jgi:hypothetical protein